MYDIPTPLPNKPTRFLDQFRAFIRSKNLAYRTEKTYWRWVISFIRFSGTPHPSELGKPNVEKYLSFLSVQRKLAVNTQKTALNALAFLYNQFLKKPLGELDFSYSNRQKRLPTVFSHQEALPYSIN